jgi:lysophospholipase L1-like esterase
MNILFLGDSLIEYFDWNERFPDQRVLNLGMAGESVQGLLSRVMKISDISEKAEMIFIMTGINNIAMGDRDFISFYRIILERLQETYPQTAIYVSSLLPTRIEFIDNQSIHAVNDRLNELALNMNVNYMDIYKMFVDTKGNPIRDYLMADGVHISPMGYDVWSRAVEQVIG